MSEKDDLPQDSSASMMETEASRYKPNPNIKLVLNGGKRTLDTATVPVEWHFSKELIAKKPRYIVVCDHPGRLSDVEDLSFNFGYRHLVRVCDLMTYVQLRSAGLHHFVFMVFNGDEEEALKAAYGYMRMERSGVYESELLIETVRNNNAENDISDCEMAMVEFEVPIELFSPRPTGVLGKATWAWANRWYSSAPVDQCEYRRRKIIAFTVQPPLFLIGRLMLGVIGTLFTLIGALALIICGWRPVPVMKNILHCWVDIENGHDSKLNQFDSWRMWKKGDWTKGTEDWFLPIYAVPGILASVVLIGYILGHCLAINGHAVINLSELFVITVCLAIGVGGGLLSKKLNSPERRKRIQAEKERIRAERERNMAELAQREEEQFQAFLLENASLESTPDHVDVKKVIKKVDTLTRFSLSFWATKVKVCRPYAKQ